MSIPLPLSLAAIAVAALALTACTAADEPGNAETTAAAAEETAAAEAADVYVTRVTTLEAGGEEYSDQRPEKLFLSEFSTANDLEWHTWGPETAVASGRVSGTWCWPDCEAGYEATVVLCDVADDHFTRFGVFGELPIEPPEDWILGSPLYIGGAPWGEDEPYGCEEPDLTGLA